MWSTVYYFSKRHGNGSSVHTDDLIRLQAVESSFMVLIILESYVLDVAGGTWVSKARTESSKGENSWIQRGRGIFKVI
jgi:hypothetical protein